MSAILNLCRYACLRHNLCHAIYNLDNYILIPQNYDKDAFQDIKSNKYCKIIHRLGLVAVKEYFYRVNPACDVSKPTLMR